MRAQKSEGAQIVKGAHNVTQYRSRKKKKAKALLTIKQNNSKKKKRKLNNTDTQKKKKTMVPLFSVLLLNQKKSSFFFFLVEQVRLFTSTSLNQPPTRLACLNVSFSPHQTSTCVCVCVAKSRRYFFAALERTCRRDAAARRMESVEARSDSVVTSATPLCCTK